MEKIERKFKRPTKEQAVQALKGGTRGGDHCPGVFEVLQQFPSFKRVSLPGPSDWLNSHYEIEQSYALYSTTKYTNLFTAERNSVYIAPLEKSITEKFINLLTKFCEAFYLGATIKITRAVSLEDPKVGSKITSRINEHTHNKQYQCHDLLAKLSSNVPKDAYCLMGCLNTDLYPDENWNFVFGIASKVSRVGVFSFARFSNTFYDPSLKEDLDSLEYRALKVMVHEIGHTFNLKHCIYHECGMNGVNHADELMAKPLEFCAVCLKKLQWNIKFDLVTRFEQLAKICRESGNKLLKELGLEYELKIQYLAEHNIVANTKSVVEAPTEMTSPTLAPKVPTVKQTPINPKAPKMTQPPPKPK